ncbi:nucleotidyltransferase family protein [Acidobacteriota bacterium]
METLISEEYRNICLQWLFLLCRNWLVPEKESKERLAPPSDLDWDILGRMAYYHQLEPILFNLATKELLPKSNIPEKVFKEWEKAYYSNIMQNSELLDLTSRFIDKSSEMGISMLVLKGFEATARVYKDLGLRSMVDLDFFCRKKDLVAMSEIAFSLGCRREGDISPWHLHLVHQDLSILVELHFCVYDNIKKPGFFLRSSWQRMERLKIEETSIPVLPVENAIVFDIAHMKDHNHVVPIRVYLDFLGKLILQKEKFNWDYFSSLLDRTKLKEEFFCLFSALSEILDIRTEIPFQVDGQRSSLNDYKNRILHLASSRGFVQTPLVGARFKSKQGFFQKLLFSFKRFFPPIRAIQAANNISSPVLAAFFVPIQAFRIFQDIWIRKKRENGEI